MDYDKLKKQMRQVIRIAKEVIAECEKDAPDDILISDDTTEELFELADQIIVTVNGGTSALCDSNRGVFIAG
jgi:histone H3/H4